MDPVSADKGVAEEQKPLVVLKFGGSSVADAERMHEVACLVRRYRDPLRDGVDHARYHRVLQLSQRQIRDT